MLVAPFLRFAESHVHLHPGGSEHAGSHTQDIGKVGHW